MPGDTLIVYVPGLIGYGPISSRYLTAADPLLQRLREELQAAPEDVWQYPHQIRLFNRGPLSAHAQKLCNVVEQYWEHRGKPDRIILIGHSIGGILVRYAYLLAAGKLRERSVHAWSYAVQRIVLLAAPNRGVDPRRMRWPDNWIAGLGFWATPGRAAAEIRIGSTFMTDLRLEWTRELGASGTNLPLTVQVIGDVDTIVEPEDSSDVMGSANGVALTLPNATHFNIPCLSGVPESFPGQRYELLRRAVLGEDLAPTEPADLPEHARRYTAIVFILHGIRAGNDTWVQQLTDLLSADGTVGVVSASYGRFSAYNFAVPITRRRTLRWFQDNYSYHLTKYPNLPFHFIGHSNGTYMLGQSLRRVHAMRFARVYLAGSVLPRDFEWQRCHDRGQVGQFVNICSSKDKPVAWLCSALRGLGMRDIGEGGFTGFDVLPDNAHQFRYLNGDHGAALAPDRLPAIAEYIRTGQISTPTKLTHPTMLFSLISRLAPVLARVTVAGVIATISIAIAADSTTPLVVLAAGLAVVIVALRIA
jgi:pimeloyl-ACP methyl ester carboxylesterase